MTPRQFGAAVGIAVVLLIGVVAGAHVGIDRLEALEAGAAGLTP